MKNNKRSKVASKKDESNVKIKGSAKVDSQKSTSDSIELKKTNQRTGNKTIKKELNDEAPLEIISAGKSSNVKNELPEVETIGARELQKLKRTTRKKNIMKPQHEDDALEKLPITKSSKINDISIDSIPTTSTGMNKKNIQKTKNDDKSSSEVLKELKKESIETNWEPTNWKLILDNIRRMRSTDKAPVDTMGCHKCADENADEKVIEVFLITETIILIILLDPTFPQTSSSYVVQPNQG